MKTRIFSGDCIKTIETNVNRFIKDKHVVSLTQSESFDCKTSKFNLTITVLYEEYARYDYLNARITNESLNGMMK